MNFIPAPQFPAQSLTPAQKAGLAYQRRVGKFLTLWSSSLGWELLDGPWLVGPCQPDFLLVSPSGCVLVVEAKLTQVDCERQFVKYKKATGGICLQVCRRLVAPATVSCLEDTIDGGVMLLWV